MTLRIGVLRGPALDAALDDVARLRIAVFRDWPYLYDGDPEYERRYLQVYRNSPGAVLVGAFDGTRLVGAATGTPMADHAQDFAAAFAGTGLALDRVFYCAESVLLPAFRGQGAGTVQPDHLDQARAARAPIRASASNAGLAEVHVKVVGRNSTGRCACATSDAKGRCDMGRPKKPAKPSVTMPPSSPSSARRNTSDRTSMQNAAWSDRREDAGTIPVSASLRRR
jgi:hypothetical protein